MEDSGTVVEGTGQGVAAVAASVSRNTPVASITQEPQSDAASERVNAKLLPNSQPVREGTQVRDDLSQEKVKEEPDSPLSLPKRSPSAKIEPMLLSSFQHVHKALANEDTKKLEFFSKFAKLELGKLVEPLNKVIDVADSKRILQNVEELLQRPVTARTITGIIGETGAGKSSLINALLGEIRLLPTNGMRACTAAVTEISWNDSTKPDESYRAEVEFISLEDWKRELEHLYSDLLVDGVVSKDASNKKTEAGIAMAKIRSVYPYLDDEFLLRKNAKQLAHDKSLREILGTTMTFKADSASKLYQQIKPYMDSNDAARRRKVTDNNDPVELWPLTKVVRIYTKADVLSTGVVLVDLPGCGDANAARGTVAEKYMEKCTSIWIVAPISRAVDNKAAQHLLGESFKMQLKYDGNYTNITFICSQSDGLAVEEMAESLELGDSLAECNETERNIKATIASKEAEMRTSEVSINNMQAERKTIEKQISLWSKLGVQAKNGKSVFAPSSQGGKRKSNTSETQPQKKQRRSARSNAMIMDSDDEDDAVEEPEFNGENGHQPLTTAQIESTINALDNQRVSLTGRIRAEKEVYFGLDSHCASLEAELKQQTLDLRSDSIRRRNDYCRTTIQQDFAHGLKMLDQETAMQDQGDNFDPEKDIRDYEAVANLLPVFCVSSREYQKKCGRAKVEAGDDGFATQEDTEIPQLLEHAKMSTDVSRAKNCKKLLNNAIQLWQSLQLWAVESDSGIALTEEQMNTEAEMLDHDLEKLKKALKDTANSANTECKNIMRKNLFNKFKTAVTKSAKEARPIAESWATAKKDDGRRLYPFQTYRAVMKRRGYYKKGDTEIDFNEELTRPLKVKLAASWESSFCKEIPEALERFCHSVEQHMHWFHEILCMRIKGTGAASRIDMLKPQLEAYIQGIKDLQDTYRLDITQKQREASRDFAPEIRETMLEAYDKCAEQSGRGVYARMQQIIDRHIVAKNRDMYDQATKQVQKSLNRMTNNYNKDMLATVDNTVDSMASDYKNCILKRDLPAASLAVRREIIRIVSKVDDEFRLQVAPEPPGESALVTTSDATKELISGVTAATSIEDGTIAGQVATDQPTAKADDSGSANPPAGVELPKVKDEPLSQNSSDNSSDTVDQVMGGTDT
ncbi:hypothetical protein PG990_005452 [Apiospora arundinis]|uniref:Nuclear GTPase SLIP-GC n=1 Tax=Apiospora arundinis TaxID=335852 RepID=A0ABR2J7Y2_9PEZI